MLVALLVTVACWALNVIVVKWAVGQWQPAHLLVWRNWLGVIVLLAFVKRRRDRAVERRDLPLVLFSALIGIVINQLGFMYATTYTTATTISLVLASIPAFAAISASVLGHERIVTAPLAGHRRRGGRHVARARGRPRAARPHEPPRRPAGAARGRHLGHLLGAREPLFARYSPNRMSTLVLCAAVPMLTVVGLPQVVHQDYGAITLGGWGALVFSVFFWLVFTNILWFGAIQRGGAARATAVMPIQPFLGALFAFVLLGETRDAGCRWRAGS